MRLPFFIPTYIILLTLVIFIMFSILASHASIFAAAGSTGSAHTSFFVPVSDRSGLTEGRRREIGNSSRVVIMTIFQLQPAPCYSWIPLISNGINFSKNDNVGVDKFERIII